MKKPTSVIIGGALIAGACWASPALADDWTLACDFDSGLQATVGYHAGEPAYDFYVGSSGSSDLGRGQRFPLGHLMSPTHSILFTRDDGPIQMVLRIERESLTATLETGSQVSWDYRSATGNCRIAEQ